MSPVSTENVGISLNARAQRAKKFCLFSALSTCVCEYCFTCFDDLIKKMDVL